jgi:CRP-like cAMP-binding protein
MGNPSIDVIVDAGLKNEILERSVKFVAEDGFLFLQGKPPNALYFVKSGKVQMAMMARERVALSFIAGEGSLLGLPATFSNQPYSMTAKASPTAEIFRLGADTFYELLTTDSRMQEAAWRILASEVRAARQALSDELGRQTGNTLGKCARSPSIKSSSTAPGPLVDERVRLYAAVEDHPDEKQ